jgi:hypothetical protein
MELNEKTKKLLDKACLRQFGLTFDQSYRMVELQEKKKTKSKGITDRKGIAK